MRIDRAARQRSAEESARRADRGSDDDVAQPMMVRVETADADERGRGDADAADQLDLRLVPPLCLEGDRGRDGERRHRVLGEERRVRSDDALVRTAGVAT